MRNPRSTASRRPTTPAHTYFFTDPERGLTQLLSRGYCVLSDRAAGTLLAGQGAKAGRFVHLAPDGEAVALAEYVLPCRLADYELSEVAV